MGASWSAAGTSARKPVTQVGEVCADDADYVLKDFNMSAPTAAVIGAGIAGVHTAYELAQLGFRVTVFEQRGDVCLGETQYALPFVGVGLIYPYINSLRIGRELLWPKLWFGSSSLVTINNSWDVLFSSLNQRWLWARRWCRLSEEEVMGLANNLSRLSVGVINDLSRKHRSLSPHVVSRDVNVQMLHPKGQDCQKALTTTSVKTAHDTPLMIDPVGWTRELARIARDRYGVEFFFSEKLLDITTYLRYDTELVSNLRFSRSVDGGVEYSNRKFDVVVLAAGEQTGKLTGESSQIPVIGLSGCSVAVQPSRGDEIDCWRGKLPFQSPCLVTLSPDSHIVSYKTHVEQPAKAAETFFLQGLLSFDAVSNAASCAEKMLLCMEEQLRRKCAINLPLLSKYREYNKVLKQQAHQGNTGGVSDIQTSGASVMHVSQYTRSFTPDGIPLISKSGAAFNSFICTGFGDHAVDMAPGAAKILAKLVELEACAMLHQDEKEMERKGYAVESAVSDERLNHTRQQMQLLLNGCRTASDILPGQSLKEYAQIPYSSARFGGVVKDNVHDIRYTSFLRRLGNWERQLVQFFIPWEHYINQRAIQLARQDNMPDWLRTIVYYYFTDEEDDLEMLQNRRKYVEGIRRIRDQFEGGIADQSPTVVSSSPPSSSSLSTRH
uniref:FAD-dependent oxidoreductase domain-containing protein 1 n=1 Tax=Trypanosoma congolense (strain IL3000) TaxID=1068625 RepID=G0UX99_TRYCI|nr:conserved hypothetical protein [Trypanosoma congolense IL3000]